MGPEHLPLSCVRQAVLTIVVLMRYGLPTCQRSCVGEVAQGGGRWKSVVQWWQWAVSTAMIFARTFACKNAIWKATGPHEAIGASRKFPWWGTLSNSRWFLPMLGGTIHRVPGNKGRAGERAVKCRTWCLASRGERGRGQRTCVV